MLPESWCRGLITAIKWLSSRGSTTRFLLVAANTYNTTPRLHDCMHREIEGSMILQHQQHVAPVDLTYRYHYYTKRCYADYTAHRCHFITCFTVHRRYIYLFPLSGWSEGRVHAARDADLIQGSRHQPTWVTFWTEVDRLPASINVTDINVDNFLFPRVLWIIRIAYFLPARLLPNLFRTAELLYGSE